MTRMRLEPIDPQGRSRELVSIWNERYGRRFPLDERLLLQNLRMEKNTSSCVGAFDGRRLCGFVLYKQQTKKLGDKGASPKAGNISMLSVSADAHAGAFLPKLLERAQADLRARGVERLHFGRDTCHLFPGAPIDAPEDLAFEGLLAEQGYEPGETVHDLWADLRLLDFGAAEGLEQGAAPASPHTRFEEHPRGANAPRFEEYAPAVRKKVEAFFSRAFPGRWQQDCLDALDAGMLPRDLILLFDGDRLIGFSRVYDSASTVLGPGVYWRKLLGDSPGGLGPIGVDEAYRGRGLGLELLRESLKRLSARGVGLMAIDWTDLVKFYGKMGFRVWRSYRMYSKDLAKE